MHTFVVLWQLLLLGALQLQLGSSTFELSHESSITSGNSGQLQDIVAWDEYSVTVRGERVLFFSGEFHPWRLPSPGLWLDVFEKIKALGFSGVSFYINWALVEGEPGIFRADGIFALEEFFNAAMKAGIYLLARPGPYINSEVSGGGYPGWVSRIKGPVRTNSTDWLTATGNYINNIGAIISKSQITNGGPVILFQPENEYTLCASALSGGGGLGNISACLNHYYMADVEAMWRDSGIVVPFLFNDAVPVGNFVPGSGIGAADIYGFDMYPLGWGESCTNPTNWSRATGLFPLQIVNYTTHMQMSPSTPLSVVEFQGGTSEGWGGAGMAACAAMLNDEFERVFYKIMYGLRTTVFNLYMMFGGTNWGNIGHPGGYTSYDVGAAITEDRQVTREKYSELKLQANFLRMSPSYLTALPDNGSFGIYTNTTRLVTTRLISNESDGDFYIIRQSDYASSSTIMYTLLVETRGTNLTVPQLGGSLSLRGRDSKIHVVNYRIGDIDLVYSTAEVFTWKKSSNRTVLILYGGARETHEFALPIELGIPSHIEGSGVRSSQVGSLVIIQWDVETERRVVSFGGALEILLLWRNDVYNYWVLDLLQPKPLENFTCQSRINATDTSVVVKAGYLLRTARVSNNTLYLRGDINSSTVIEVISSPVSCSGQLYFNEQLVANGRLSGNISFVKPDLALPDLSRADWRYLDSLPEIKGIYNDQLWVEANLTNSNNTRALTTPTSLYASDYGFHAGSLIYRGHFIATGQELKLFLSTSGGYAFSHSVWVNSSYLGSWIGDPESLSYNQTFCLPAELKAGAIYVITVLIDHMGLAENTFIDVEGVKEPRGILDYSLTGHAQIDIRWKLTGNLGGEQYYDLSRGPRNEGALMAERQGFHLPGAPLDDLQKRSPILQGVEGVGVGFFSTTFDLDIPNSYDIPMSFVFKNISQTTNETSIPAYRVQIFVNGWQFGKYINNIGPQFSFPVPEGILNYNGENYIAVTLWSLEPDGAKIGGLSLETGAVLRSSYQKPALVLGQQYALRDMAY